MAVYAPEYLRQHVPRRRTAWFSTSMTSSPSPCRSRRSSAAVSSCVGAGFDSSDRAPGVVPAHHSTAAWSVSSRRSCAAPACAEVVIVDEAPTTDKAPGLHAVARGRGHRRHRVADLRSRRAVAGTHRRHATSTDSSVRAILSARGVRKTYHSGRARGGGAAGHRPRCRCRRAGDGHGTVGQRQDHDAQLPVRPRRDRRRHASTSTASRSTRCPTPGGPSTGPAAWASSSRAST